MNGGPNGRGQSVLVQVRQLPLVRIGEVLVERKELVISAKFGFGRDPREGLGRRAVGSHAEARGIEMLLVSWGYCKPQQVVVRDRLPPNILRSNRLAQQS